MEISRLFLHYWGLSFLITWATQRDSFSSYRKSHDIYCQLVVTMYKTEAYITGQGWVLDVLQCPSPCLMCAECVFYFLCVLTLWFKVYHLSKQYFPQGSIKFLYKNIIIIITALIFNYGHGILTMSKGPSTPAPTVLLVLSWEGDFLLTSRQQKVVRAKSYRRC